MHVSSRKPDQKWTDREDAILKTMLAEKRTRREVGELLGRSTSSVDSRARKLGYHTGPRIPGAKRWREQFSKAAGPMRTAELGKPLDLGPGDDRYVAACLAQGGFIYRIKLHGINVEVRP